MNTSRTSYKRFFLGLFLIGVLCVSLSIAAIGATQSDSQRQITDMTGRTVSIPTSPDRVVGVGPGALRLLVYLEALNKVVGVEHSEKTWGKLNPYNIANPEIRSLPSIGPHFGGDPELIAAQRPDLVVWGFATAGQANDLQRQLDIPVLVISYGVYGKEFSSFYRALRLLGRALGRENQASNLISYTRSIISDLEQRVADLSDQSRPSVYVGGISYQGGVGIQSTQPRYLPLTILNTPNVASNIAAVHAMIDLEQIIVWNPQYMFISGSNFQRVMKDLKQPVFQSVTAVRKNHIYRVHPVRFYELNVGTVLANSYYIGEVLYPKQFQDINPVTRSAKIYDAFVGGNPYPELVEAFGACSKVHVPQG